MSYHISQYGKNVHLDIISLDIDILIENKNDKKNMYMTFGKKGFVIFKKMTRILSFSYILHELLIYNRTGKIQNTIFIFAEQRSFKKFSVSFNEKNHNKELPSICKKIWSRSIFLVGNTTMVAETWDMKTRYAGFIWSNCIVFYFILGASMLLCMCDWKLYIQGRCIIIVLTLMKNIFKQWSLY